MERADYRRTSYEVWEAMAPGWERWRAQLASALTPVREWLIDQLAPRPGDTVLELSAGAGDTGFAAAAIVGEKGRVISSDFSAEMVEVARRRGGELGLGNVDYRVIDAERIALETDSVDAVLSQSGYMLMADPAAALAETRRVLRAGGRLALSVWGAPERNPWASIGGRILVERGLLPPPDPEAPGVFSMASEERTRALLGGADFADVRTDEVAVRFAFRDVDDRRSRPWSRRRRSSTVRGRRWPPASGTGRARDSGPPSMLAPGPTLQRDSDTRQAIFARTGHLRPAAADGYFRPGYARTSTSQRIVDVIDEPLAGSTTVALAPDEGGWFWSARP